MTTRRKVAESVFDAWLPLETGTFREWVTWLAYRSVVGRGLRGVNRRTATVNSMAPHLHNI